MIEDQKERIVTVILHMKDYETILHHEIIRNTVGYDFISDLDLFDLLAVINFLEITLDYSKLDNI